MTCAIILAMASALFAAPAGREPGIEALRRLVEGRRSVRRYQPGRSVSHTILEDLLAWASWAPSTHNRQPWRFCVVTDAEVKKRLAEAMAERWRCDLAAGGAPAEEIQRRTAASTVRIAGAAALVLAALSMADMDAYPDEPRRQAEWTMAVQSTALACQNLLLAAHAYGLGACWMCAPLFAPEIVRQVLDLPQDWQPQGLITLGYAAEERTSTRAALETRVLWR